MEDTHKTIGLALIAIVGSIALYAVYTLSMGS